MFGTNYQLKIPCETCIHNTVCSVKSKFLETEVKTTHPFVKVALSCVQYHGNLDVIQLRRDDGLREYMLEEKEV